MLKTSEDIRNIRINNSRLQNPNFKTPKEVVAWFGAVQAQDFSPTLWSISQRLDHKTSAIDIEDSVNKGEIIRSWPMRGTIHFMTSENIKWMVNLLAPRVIKRMQNYYQKLELDQKVFDQAKKFITKSLEKEKLLTRPELYKLLEENKIVTKGMRGLFILGYLAMSAYLSFGPKKGKQPTFVLLDEWAKDTKDFKGEEAMTEMAKLYYQSHGPAQIVDLMMWTGMNKTEATKATNNVKSLVKEVVNGKEYFMLPVKSEIKLNKKVFLLSAYDEYTIAFKDRSDILKSSELNPVSAVNGYWNAMVLDGVVIGMFRRVMKKDSINFSFSPITKLSSSEVELFHKEADRYASFYGQKAVIS